MKVCSVNLANGSPRTESYIIDRDAVNNLALELHGLCNRLDTPNEEFYRIFAQLRSVSITKIPQEKITLEPGGVVGDRHFSIPELKQVDDNFFKIEAFSQVSLLSKERYIELNKFYNKDLQAGQLGENILTQELAWDKLSQGTILQFGNSALIKICFLRRFCFKFGVAMWSPDEYFNWRKSPGSPPINRIGVIGQVIKPGTVVPGDSIRILYKPPENIKLRALDHLVDGVASRTPCDPPTNT